MAKIHSNPAAPPSSKPGTKAEKAAKPKKEKVVRIFYPGLNAQPVKNEDGSPKLNKSGKEILKPTTKLTEVPADFDIKLHKPLNRDAFADESLYFELRAQDFEKKAAAMRKQGADIKALGNVKDRAAAKKLQALQKRMVELVASLKAAGVDTAPMEAKIAAELAAAQQPAQSA